MSDASIVKEPWGRGRLSLAVGLPMLAAVVAGGTWWTVDRVEQRVVSTVVDDLALAGVDHVDLTIEADYRTGVVRGVLPAGVDVTRIRNAIGGGPLTGLDLSELTPAPAGARTAEPDPAPELAELATGPVEIEAVYDGIRLSVRGVVLTEGQHNAVLETLDLVTGRAEIDEQLVISRLSAETDGVDDRIADLLTAIEAVDGADSWTIRLTDRRLMVEAAVADAELAASVGSVTGSLRATATSVRVQTGEGEGI